VIRTTSCNRKGLIEDQGGRVEVVRFHRRRCERRRRRLLLTALFLSKDHRARSNANTNSSDGLTESQKGAQVCWYVQKQSRLLLQRNFQTSLPTMTQSIDSVYTSKHTRDSPHRSRVDHSAEASEIFEGAELALCPDHSSRKR